MSHDTPCAGVIQCTEKDEFAYQEMIAHLPLCGIAVSKLQINCNPCPCSVSMTAWAQSKPAELKYRRHPREYWLLGVAMVAF